MNKVIASTSILLTIATGGYLISEKQVGELEQKIDQIQYIQAKQVIDERGDIQEIATKIVASTSPEKLVIGGVEYIKK